MHTDFICKYTYGYRCVYVYYVYICAYMFEKINFIAIPYM